MEDLVQTLVREATFALRAQQDGYAATARGGFRDVAETAQRIAEIAAVAGAYPE